MDRFILYPLFLAALAASAFLGWQLFEYATALHTWQTAKYTADAKIRIANGRIDDLNEMNARLRGDLAAATAAQESTAQELEIYRNALQESNNEISKANETIAEREQQLRTARDQLNTVRNEKNAALFSLDVERRNLAAEKRTTERQATAIASLESSLRSKDNRITQLSGQVNQQSTQITRQRTQITRQTSQILQKDATIANLQTSLSEARTQRVLIPTCSSNYYTASGGQLSCVARNSAAFQATQTESWDITLPQTGRVTLKINRSGEVGADRSMDLLEHAVRTIESYMGVPIPLQGREIRLDFVKELSIDGDFGGVHIHHAQGSHMEILQEYDSVEPQASSNWWDNIFGTSQQSDPADRLAEIIAHEVAHYYWYNNRTWLDEGAADFFELYSENRRTGAPIRAKNRRCAQVANISQLEGQRYESTDDGFRCNYSLGEGLFVDLYNAMSASGFRQAFRELYAEEKDKRAGVHQVRQAYPGSWSIIDKWYGYREKPEAHWNNGEFLGYYIWEENGEYRLTTRNGRPCATTLRMNDNPTRYEPWLTKTRDECYYTGTWSDEGHLLVTISGTTYRAVDVKIGGPPRYGKDGAVRPGKGSPSLTVIGLRGELWND